MKFQIKNIIDHFATATEQDIEKFMSWVKGKTPAVINAFSSAYGITQTIIKEATSPSGLAAEAIVEKFFPPSAAIFPALLALVQTAGASCKAIADDIPGVEGVAVRYGAEIVSVIDGAKDSIDNYLVEFQKMFTSSPATA
jgi:hypothetical protein